MGNRLVVTGIILSAILLVPVPAAAQVSLWLQKGVSGAGGDAGLTIDKDVNQFIGRGGYSYRGVLEGEILFTYASIKNDMEYGPEATGSGGGAGVHVHPIKQSAGMPISVDLSADITRVTINSELLEDQGISVNSNAFIAGLGIYRFIRVSPTFGVIPAAGLALSHSWVRSPEFPDFKASDTNVAIALTGNVAYIDQRGYIWAAAPALRLGEKTAFTIAISFIVPFGNSDDDEPSKVPPPVALH